MKDWLARELKKKKQNQFEIIQKESYILVDLT